MIKTTNVSRVNTARIVKKKRKAKSESPMQEPLSFLWIIKIEGGFFDDVL